MDKRILIAMILVLSLVGTASATNWSVDDSGGTDFTGIQEAINNASTGDTILVYSGIYYENVVVNKSVTLKGIGNPIVDAGGEGNAIILSVDAITVEGFNVTNSGSPWWDAGIEVISSNNNITGNNVCNMYRGIALSSCNNNTITGNNVYNNLYSGIIIASSSNNTLTGNTFVNDGLIVSSSYPNTIENNTVNGKPLVYLEDVSDCKVEDAGLVILVNCNNITVENLDLSNTCVGVELWQTEYCIISSNNVCNNNVCGIYTDHSNNNIITGNTANNNSRIGIMSTLSSNNTIIGNNVRSNSCGISLAGSNNNIITRNTFVNDGLRVSSSYQNTVEDNTVNGKPLVYLEDVSNYKVEDAGQVILVNCSNITVENQDLFNTSVGLELWKTEDCIISNNNVSNNRCGIFFCYSCNNITITGNTLDDDGIQLINSCNNKIYLNNFLNNSDNVVSSFTNNLWNTTSKKTYAYNGSTYSSYLGNYWSDYKEKYPDAEEIGSTGIWNTPYRIEADNDFYPLIQPQQNYIQEENISKWIHDA